MSQSSAFAECLMKPKTKIFFDFLDYKTRYRENIGIEVKGGTRTGKSTVSQAICKYISHLTGQPFTLWHSCANEIEYLEKLKTPNLPYACAFLIDEQSLSIKERVITDCGIIRLGDLNPMEQINILSLNLKTLKKEYVSATKVNNKMKPVFRITTENGKKVEATEDHVFFVDEKGKIVEKRLKELKNGDKLICL